MIRQAPRRRTDIILAHLELGVEAETGQYQQDALIPIQGKPSRWREFEYSPSASASSPVEGSGHHLHFSHQLQVVSAVSLFSFKRANRANSLPASLGSGPQLEASPDGPLDPLARLLFRLSRCLLSARNGFVHFPKN